MNTLSKYGNMIKIAMNTRNLIYVVIMCLLCSSFCACSDDIEAKNKRLFVLVNTSFVNDAKKKQKYRHEVGLGLFTEKDRINAVCKCAEAHLDELKLILNAYQPEVLHRRGPYGTSRLEFSADSSLLFELKGLINAYEGLLSLIKENHDVTIEGVHEHVVWVNLHKRNFYEHAKTLRLMK